MVTIRQINNKERQSIENGGFLFPVLSEKLKNSISTLFSNGPAVGHAEGREEGRQSVYFYDLDSSNTYIGLRIADHAPNIWHRFYYNSHFPPSQQPYGTICFLFVGVEETKPGARGHNISIPSSKRVMYIDKERFDKWEDFDYVIYRYRPGLFTDGDIEIMKDAVSEWKSNEGSKPFPDPYIDDEYKKAIVDTFRIRVEPMTARRTNENVYVEMGNGDDTRIKLGDVIVLNEDKSVYLCAEIWLYSDSIPDYMLEFMVDENDDKLDQMMKDYYDDWYRKLGLKK